MKIITYCKTLDLDDCQEIHFDHENAMVRFFIGGFVEQFNFACPATAFDFMNEITEGVYNGSPCVDLSHIIAIPETLNVIKFKDEVKERINNYNPSEYEEDI
jgi:hypothetical protein